MKINYITGHAGTGKSHYLVEQITALKPEDTIVIVPTHKAGSVLETRLLAKSTSAANLYEIKTMHSVLGWIPGVNEAADDIAKVDVTVKLIKELPEYKNIVIDEFSMISEDMLMTLTGMIDEQCDYESDHITLTLYGDPYQLPPVKGTPIQTDPDTTTHLTKQYRSESPDIVELFTKFVRYMEGSNTMDLTVPESKHVKYVDSITGFKEGDRLLAFTNEAVGNYNQQIARSLGVTGYEGQTVQLGSMLEPTYMEQWLHPSLEDLLEWYDSGRLRMQNARINKKFLEHSLRAMISDPDIQFITEEYYVYPVIVGVGNAYKIRNTIKAVAVEAKGKDRSRAWARYYALERAYTMDYTYASTTHKSQGNEFNTVWIDKGDISRSIFRGNYNTYARLMYVALSRSIKNVKIL